MCGVKYKEIQDRVHSWFKAKRGEGISVTPKAFKSQASIISRKLGIANFKASCNWFARIKKRLNIRYLAVCGELLDTVDDEAVFVFLQTLEKHFVDNGLSPCQIYNCDETGIFYKTSSKRTLASSEEHHALGRKANKQRITAHLCSNATGDNKLRLMIIGQSRKPRVFSDFPVDDFAFYKGNRSSWMTREFFQNWFEEEFVPSVRAYSYKMQIEPKALLVLDNAPCHPTDLVSDDGLIKVFFLPPRSTPKLQPMDIGIIRSLKARYNNDLWNAVLGGSIDVNFKNLTLDKVIPMLYEAWNEIPSSTIINSFAIFFGGKEGILSNLPDIPNHFEEDDLIPLNILLTPPEPMAFDHGMDGK